MGKGQAGTGRRQPRHGRPGASTERSEWRKHGLDPVWTEESNAGQQTLPWPQSRQAPWQCGLVAAPSQRRVYSLLPGIWAGHVTCFDQ